MKSIVLAGGGALALLLSGCGGGASAAAKAQPTLSTAPAVVSASPTATASPTASTSGEPLDPDTVVAADGSAPKAQPAYATKAVDLLATLPVKGRAPKTGYTRDQFGQAWADVDHNGCDTRNDILARDLTGTAYTAGSRCRIASGTLDDPCTGKAIGFVRGNGTSTAVQIDHVVALSDAWQKGAQQLTAAQRTALANDPLNLLAVDGPTNEAKGDGDAATWLPSNRSYRCQYVARQVSVKATYGLWVTRAEHDAIARVLASCPDQQVPTDQKAPAKAAPAPAVPAAPAPVAPAPAQPAPAPVAPAPAPAGVYYANCAAARAAGAAPLYAGQPGYSTKLDRDRDGVACE
ncbi:pyruvate/2-oxoglutarate dehydrogenase complex dihydrolipoamide acyltransferase (E2) component [Sinomonas atrocyanea]|nr:pyruvate/2-oxoglutarate dehydrogenase complex dihydrolipoamide acyltransferase (E2) component [Sinomonas atrocyanea]